MKKSDSGKHDKTDPKDAKKLSESPLQRMGITEPELISRYTLREENNEDVLRVYYRKKHGSLLPASKKYTFGRSHQTIITNSGAPVYAKDHIISPILQAALAELDKIVRHTDDAEELKKAVLDEIEHMEKYLCSKIKELRSQVERL